MGGAKYKMTPSEGQESSSASNAVNISSGPGPLAPKGYTDVSTNDLTTLTGALLLTADCMGTGILALPHDMKILGPLFGLSFLILNLPINWYAGKLLGDAATFVEMRAARMGLYDSIVEQDDVFAYRDSFDASFDGDFEGDEGLFEIGSDDTNDNSMEPPNSSESKEHNTQTQEREQSSQQQRQFEDSNAHTYDFIGMTTALFGSFTKPTRMVTFIYYANLILVLGNYVLVMSHAISAIFQDQLCLPTAGLLSATLMFGLCQLRTMSSLGRVVSFVSLGCLAIVVFQCIVAIQQNADVGRIRTLEQNDNEEEPMSTLTTIMRQFAAISSIGFAVGSQKLFLNIRHECHTRSEAPKSLALALIGFGTVYVTVCLAAGDNPPGFLFDAIPAGPGRQWAGLFLWIHVSVSFAINSQAFCSSLDRIYFYSVGRWNLKERHRLRWGMLTCGTTLGSLFIANAVPFFKDLVALIGALTSVPLTLLLPALYHRKIRGLDLFGCCFGSSTSRMNYTNMTNVDTMGLTSSVWQKICDRLSFGLVVFSLGFLGCGLVGSLYSITMDWSDQREPFACH